MEMSENTPKSDVLKQMPYSELKKLAKQHGLKGNMKAEKIIAALCSLNSKDIESFSTPAQKEINSSKQNKEGKFDEDFKTPLATPRRGTFSIETPAKEDKVTPEKITPKKLTYATESPTSIKVGDSSNASMSFDTSVLDMSNVTIGRGSERKCHRKVSFMSPVGVQSTPKNSNIKLRPKTPVAARTSLGKRVSFSSPAEGQKMRRSSEMSVRVTPHPRKSSERSLPRRSTPRLRSSFSEEHSVFDSTNPTTPLPSVPESPERQQIMPGVQTSQKEGSKSISRTDTSEKQSKTPCPSVKEPEKQAVTLGAAQSQKDGSTVRSESKVETSTKMKRAGTPNFKKIHEKAFEKMESIDDYQKRKEQNSSKKINHRPDFKSKIVKAKSKIPAFSGIPFVPSAVVGKALKFDLKEKKADASYLKQTKEDAPVEKKSKRCNENLQQKKGKAKFDLKSSLSRKLSYTPYKGPLKPLSESTNTSLLNTKEEPVNKVVISKRLQTRSVLKGVRTNKRFELQMRNRKL